MTIGQFILISPTLRMSCLPSRKLLWQDLILVDKSMERKLEVSSGGQLFPSGWPHNSATRFRSSTTTVVLNRFRTAQGHCDACKKKWNQAATDLCPCGEKQTMSHIVDCCSLSKLNSGFSQLHFADDQAVAWLILMHTWEEEEEEVNEYQLQLGSKRTCCVCCLVV